MLQKLMNLKKIPASGVICMKAITKAIAFIALKTNLSS
jgi:hypothetical protein